MDKRPITTICFLAAAFVVTSCGAFSSPSRTTKNFFYAVEAGKLDDAMKLLSNKAKGGMGEEKLRSMLGQATRKIKEHGGIDSIEITKEEITGEIADVAGTVKYKDGTSENISQKLVKEEGDWKLQ
jgi:hypothetical protein